VRLSPVDIPAALTAPSGTGVVFRKGRTPMEIEDQLRERLRKVEALYFGTTSAGEREAAGAAAERLLSEDLRS
jgi:hypothetical protein